MVNLGFSIGDLHFKNPVLTASGTFGMELNSMILSMFQELGGIILKGTTLEPQGR